MIQDSVFPGNFLFSYLTDISVLGIFLRSEDPLAVGTKMRLRFRGEGDPFELSGEVMWVNPWREDAPNPGMGVRFVDVSPESRERLVALVRAVAYLNGSADG